MPKFSKAFGRRKSTNNALEDVQVPTPSESISSFKVFERPDHSRGKSFDGGAKLAKAARPSSSPLHNEDNMFDDLKGSRGSGASNSNTASTTDQASSRFSAASTAPSSAAGHDNYHDVRSPHDKPFNDIPLPPVPKSNSGFSLKAAGRTFSFGRAKGTTPPPTRALDEFSSPAQTPQSPEGALNRPRAMTTSSYASTATPPKLEERELGLSLGGDFGDMFTSFGKRQSKALDLDVARGMSRSPDYSPTGPAVPGRAFMGRSKQPSPLHIDRTSSVDTSHAWAGMESSDRLMANTSPITTEQYRDSPPPVPRHDTVRRPAGASDGLLSRSSALAVRRQSTLEIDGSIDEDARLLRDAATAASQRLGDSNRARDSWLNYSAQDSRGGESVYQPDSVRSTSKVSRKPLAAKASEENMFDTQIASSASVAAAYQRKPPSPVRTTASSNRVMTPQQFEKYKKDQERLRSFGGNKRDDDEDDEADAYDDDEDEAEKIKQMAKQRRKQEAHMAVYRQQMMKVTGETAPPISSSRPSMVVSHSTPNLLSRGSVAPDDEEEEDEEVPLAILAAHGFPNKNRAPGRLSSMSSNPNLRASTQQLGAYPAPPGSVAGGDAGGRLPVFARNLPQDPYFGAGLVNASNRESLAYGTGAGSVHGGPTRGVQAGGLVGVIAGEERSRAMRRGSPNTQGEYSQPPPSNGFNGMGMAPMMRNPAGGMPAMPMAPGDDAQMMMVQQMQQFMQLQMQFMQAMSSGGSQVGGPVPGDMPRPATMGNMIAPQQGYRPSSQHGQPRAMASLDPNSAAWNQQAFGRNSMFTPSIRGVGNYTPSIAPSERSNVGQPGRYRPVSHVPADRSRTNTMSGALQDWTVTKQNTANASVKLVKKTGTEDEDDEEAGWKRMKQRRDTKRGMWKSKKDTSNVLGF